MKNLQKNNLLTILLISLFFISTPFVYAQEATQSATTTQEIKQSIQNRIQQVLGRDSNNEQDIPKGLIGTIESVTSQSISIDTENGNQFVSLTDESVIVDEEGTSLEVEELEIGNPALVIGVMSSNDMFEAIEIVSLEEEPTPADKKTILTSLDSINRSSRVLTVIDQTGTEIELRVNTNSSLFQNFSSQEITLSDLEVDDRVIIIYQPNSKTPSVLEVVKLMKLETDDLELEEASPSGILEP